MLTSLFWRPRWPASPVPVYLLFSGATALFSTLVFTLNLVYQATVVGLSPLQLVLVGTVLEATCFLFEVPTGIVADLYSRRLSIIIGFVLIGAGFILEGSVPTFAAVLTTQVLWGLGYTFTSGATEAWITDEVGEHQMAPVFLRATRAGLLGTVIGIMLSGSLGLISIQLPIVLGGVGYITLALVLLLVMPERNFHRTPPGDRSTFQQMTATFRDGVALARSREIVRTLLLVSLVAGLASEAFDRLWVVHLLDSFTFPEIFGTRNPVVLFALLALAGTLLSLVASASIERVSPGTISHLHPTRLMTGLAGLEVFAIVTFVLAGVAGNLWLAVGALWLKSICGTLSYPISAAWMNRNLESRTRATVLSMGGQANAIGQVAGGPALGWIGSAISVPAALIGSAVVLSPIVGLYARSASTGKASDHELNEPAGKEIATPT